MQACQPHLWSVRAALPWTVDLVNYADMAVYDQEKMWLLCESSDVRKRCSP